VADEAESVAAWLRETATSAALSASIVEEVVRDRAHLRVEQEHARRVVARAIEWRIAAVLIERANPEEVTDSAREELALAERELGTAIENMLDDSLGTPRQRKE
jgi:hypothetical protein